MRLDSLTQLIQSSDFIAFRQIAIQCLALKGFTDPYLTDGWGDGGTDVRFSYLPPNPAKVAIQVTVEKEWRTKLWRDCRKVKSELSLDRLILVSSRRIPEPDFLEESQLIWKDIEVTATKIDSQAIATVLFLVDKTDVVLSALGIELSSPERRRRLPANPRADAAASFFFFGTETSEFRTNLIRSTIISTLSPEPQGLAREAVVAKVAEVLRFHPSQTHLIGGLIDNMLQFGDLHSSEGKLSLSHTLAAATKTLAALREKQWLDLEGSIRNVLKSKVRPDSITPDFMESLIACLGALLADSGIGATKEISGTTPVGANVKSRVRELHTLLDSIAFPTSGERDILLDHLTKVASESGVGKSLLAGEVFSTLSGLSDSDLVRAFGGGLGIRTLLDASVAIPILCSLLYEPTGNRFGFLSRDFYELATRHNLELLLPLDYLQEIATHLVWAYRDYVTLVEEDPDLRGSENAFVAHYMNMKLAGRIGPFKDYILGFDFDQSLFTLDLYDDAQFYAARDLMIPRLQRLFQKHFISVRPLGNVANDTRRRAEDLVSYAIDDLSLYRPRIVTDHDTRTIAFLLDQDKFPDFALVFCTWDRLHFRVRAGVDASWEALDPAVLSDLLSLCVFSEDAPALKTPLSFIKSLTEESATQAARIWDTIVVFEKKEIHNADLFRQAKGFKSAYLASTTRDFSSKAIVDEWKKWKEKHFA
jgi:hypothetical protein